MRKRLEGRIALITGASRGIGRAVALHLAHEGAQTVLVARTQKALEELDDEMRAKGHLSPSLVPMDLRDFDEIDRMGFALFERWKKLDILIGNAGTLGSLTPMHHVRPREWDEIIAVNVTANYRLIRSMDPLLRRSDAGKVIMVSAGVTQSPKAFWATYGVSKAALEYMTLSYATEVEKTHIRVNIIDPGATRTYMRALAYPGENPKTLKMPESVTETFIKLTDPVSTMHGKIIRL